MHLIKSSGIESMMSLIQASRLNQTSAVAKRDPSLSKLESKTLSNGFCVRYCGTVHVGMEGDVRQIEKAIWRLLRSGEVKQVPARFECQEIGIKVTREVDNQVSVDRHGDNSRRSLQYNNH